VPGAPVDPQFTGCHCTLTWKVPDDDGGSALTYVVEMRRTSESSWTVVGHDMTDLEFVATGLESYSVFEFRVIAVNVAGCGPPSCVVELGNSNTFSCTVVQSGTVTLGYKTSSPLTLS